MFLFKKIVGPLFYPLSLCLEILLIGLFLLLFTRFQRTGKTVIFLGVLLLAAFSYVPVANRLAAPLERLYPPVTEISELGAVKWVVVLGGGNMPDPGVPISDQLTGGALKRVVEGIRLHHALPGSTLVFSGGCESCGKPVAETAAEVALAIGVKKSRILVEPKARDTREEALRVREIVGNESFLLVTTASHMPRSLLVFRELGLRPIPAPTDFLAHREDRLSILSFFPGAEALWQVERAFHEYMGIIWQFVGPRAEGKG